MAGVFKCVGADNKVYFSDRQCDAQQKQTKIEIQNESTPNPSHANQNWKRALRGMKKDRSYKKAEKKRKKEMREAQEKAQREVQCRNDRDLLTKLNSRTCNHYGGCTIYALMGHDEDGKEIALSEHAKQAEIKRLEASIKKNCE